MNAPLTVVEQDPSHKPLVAAIAVRMADEGIPVRAIARAARLPSEDVYEMLREAIFRGTITQMPNDDWPNGSSKGARHAFHGTPLEDEDELRLACARYFKATRLEAGFLAVLLKRNEVTKAQLHQVIEDNRIDSTNPTDQKMVDVIICKLRKKLPPHGFEIETIWSFGYAISPAGRELAIRKLLSLSSDKAA